MYDIDCLSSLTSSPPPGVSYTVYCLALLSFSWFKTFSPHRHVTFILFTVVSYVMCSVCLHLFCSVQCFKQSPHISLQLAPAGHPRVLTVRYLYFSHPHSRHVLYQAFPGKTLGLGTSSAQKLFYLFFQRCTRYVGSRCTVELWHYGSLLGFSVPPLITCDLGFSDLY